MIPAGLANPGKGAGNCREVGTRVEIGTYRSDVLAREQLSLARSLGTAALHLAALPWDDKVLLTIMR